MNEDFLTEQPIMTYLVVGIVGIVAIVGGIVAATNSDALSFEEYIDALWKLALAAAALGIGRGYVKGKKVEAGLGAQELHDYDDGEDPASDPALMGEERRGGRH